MNIVAVKTKKGLYITDEPLEKSWHSSDGLARLLFDGKNPERTWHKNWFFIPQEPERIEKLVSQPHINYRYVLIDPTMESDKIPAVMVREDVAEITEDYGWQLRDEYSHLKSLYRIEYDEQPDKLADAECLFRIVLELDEIVQFNGFSYPAQLGRYRSDGMGKITQDSVTNQLLDRILFPDIVLPSRPCELSSKQMYQIVREHIKQHINNDVAFVDSDHDFCFSVKKRIELREPYWLKKEILKQNGRSYKKRRYRENFIKSRTTQIFEMTYSPKNYGEYTPIPGMRGDNWDNLRQKIDAYLEKLMTLINTPLKDCPHCNGMGVVETEPKS